MNAIEIKRTMVGVGGGSHPGCGPDVMPTPNANQRFWIITILLVLFGLSTLKLR